TIMISITALGDLRNHEPVTRAGAQPGDVVAVTGWLGWSAAGHAVLSRGFRSPRAFVEAHRRPEPPYHAGPAAADLGATAM
ncbi:thiamine-phosphate kinase, partial [Streptomyces sp. JV178]